MELKTLLAGLHRQHEKVLSKPPQSKVPKRNLAATQKKETSINLLSLDSIQTDLQVESAQVEPVSLSSYCWRESSNNAAYAVIVFFAPSISACLGI